jgi:uncharacterized protein involved in exopolysaccharide biosynthesis
LVEIVEPAVPGDAPVKPNKTLGLTVGAIVGLLAGLFIAFWSGRRDAAAAVEGAGPR